MAEARSMTAFFADKFFWIALTDFTERSSRVLAQ
jgi:hypothetical protein